MITNFRSEKSLRVNFIGRRGTSRVLLQRGREQEVDGGRGRRRSRGKETDGRRAQGGLRCR